MVTAIKKKKNNKKNKENCGLVVRHLPGMPGMLSSNPSGLNVLCIPSPLEETMIINRGPNTPIPITQSLRN